MKSIDGDVKPIIQPQRKIPFAKREKLYKILVRLVEVRMNIDMTTDNTAMQRTRHVIPTMEELRNELNDARYFTKLDMKHGYRHMERDQALRPITTFCTHRGIQRSRSLTFGINVAVEVFHKEIHQTLPDIP